MSLLNAVSLLSFIAVAQSTLTKPHCAVSKAPKDKPMSFLELMSKKTGRPSGMPALKPIVTAPTPHEEEGMVPRDYTVELKPAHFTCMSCDVTTCSGNFVLCDVSKCIGKFYSQECWCQTERTIEISQPMWRFNQAKSEYEPKAGMQRFLCDDNCNGGVCDTESLKCLKREEACQPWWWCNSPPPNEPPRDPDQEFKSMSFLQQHDMHKDQHQVKAAGMVKNTANDFGDLKFQGSRFECASAALPPNVRNEQTYLWENRGYLVFDAAACDGSVFEHQCYCWDNFLYLSGKDPLTSNMLCDNECSWGPCEGKTCATRPPPPLEEVVKAAPPPARRALHNSNNQMIPIG